MNAKTIECVRGLAAAVLLLGLSLAAPAAARPQAGAGTGGLAVSSAAADGGELRDLMAAARRARQDIAGKKGEEREAAVRAAIEAYARLRRAAADDKAVAGEASFRMGELLVRARQHEEAAKAFEEAFRDAREKFGARALLEAAHLERRARRFDEAVAAYERVEREFPGEPRSWEARMWIGRTEMQRRDTQSARASFRKVAQGAEDPVDRIEAMDWIARSLLREGRLDEAQAVIEEAERTFRTQAAGTDRDSDRVRRALERMGARDQLERARERASGTGS